MRPRTTRKDLPSTHDVVVHIHNEFVSWLKKLKSDIIISNGMAAEGNSLTSNDRKLLEGYRRLRTDGRLTTPRRHFWE